MEFHGQCPTFFILNCFFLHFLSLLFPLVTTKLLYLHGTKAHQWAVSFLCFFISGIIYYFFQD